MAACPSFMPVVIPQQGPQLFQIRRGFQAQWNRLRLLVSSESGNWALEVQDAGTRKILYAGQRLGVRAAQTAAAEFALFQVLGPDSGVLPERLARELSWQETW